VKGDELRHRRGLLRLQKEEALTAIALRAQSKLKTHSGKPLPNKFVVPFLEQASLEDADSALIGMWADLLVTASENFESYHVHFVSIIGQLSGKQGEILKEIIGTESGRELEFASDGIRMIFLQNNLSSGVQTQFAKRAIKDEISPEDLSGETVYTIFQEMFNHVAVDPVYVSFDKPGTELWYEVEFIFQRFRDNDEVDYSILEAVGLIRRVETNAAIAGWDYRAIYYYVTDLGVHFARSCGIVSKDNDDDLDEISIPSKSKRGVAEP
jgi:hypothetical protein